MTSLTTSLSSSPQPQAGGANGAVTFIGIELAEFQNSWEVDGDAVSPEPLLAALKSLWN
ncbi:MAG: hypothetical protein ABJ050_06710 [Paracoccaceae bacterium]